MRNEVKFLRTLSVALFIVSPLILFSCAVVSDTQEVAKEVANAPMATMKPMVVELKTLDISAKDPISVSLAFILKNATDQKLDVLKWGTPLEGEFNDNMFEVVKDGERIPYIGRQVKRGAPGRRDFITLEPSGQLSVQFLLEKGYDIKAAGDYSVRYRKEVITVKTADGEIVLAPVTSEPVSFKIES